MQDYEIVSVSWKAVFRVFFAAGTCIGGIGGIVIGLIFDSSVGLLGGMFLGFATGLLSGLGAAACAVVFNELAPYFGGVPVTVKTVGPAPATDCRQLPAAGQEASRGPGPPL
jgi:hypothetical protein